jgi:hypothetical protein
MDGQVRDVSIGDGENRELWIGALGPRIGSEAGPRRKPPILSAGKNLQLEDGGSRLEAYRGSCRAPTHRMMLPWPKTAQDWPRSSP